MALGLTGWAWTHHSLPTTKGADGNVLLRGCWSLSQLCSFEARGIPPDESAAHRSALSMGTWYLAQVYLSSAHKVPYRHTFPTVCNLGAWAKNPPPLSCPIQAELPSTKGLHWAPYMESRGWNQTKGFTGLLLFCIEGVDGAETSLYANLKLLKMEIHWPA